MMIVAFRVDSSTQIGSGHLMRCLTLAKRWRKEKQAEIHFLSRDLPGNIASIITGEGFIFYKLPQRPEDKFLSGYASWLTVTQKTDAEDTINVLKQLGRVRCLVVDHYALDIAWESAIRPFVGTIFVIDDLANRKHDCDILLDQNYYLDKETRYKGLVPNHCELRLGPEHALLREEFYEIKKKLRHRNGKVHSILVFYGGVDLTNETMKALRALVELSLPDITVDVVTGKSNPHKDEIEQYCQQYEFLRYHCQISNMAELMNQADLALGAGGTTTWERLYLELPSIVTAVAENQVKICEDCEKAGLIEYLGYSAQVNEDQLKRKLNEACGVLFLREAEEGDKDLLYAWRNDEIVRSNSVQSGWVPYKDHCKWFQRVQQNQQEKLWILCQGKERIGQIRLTKIVDGFVISYSIAREYRGQGFGKAMLQLVENLLYRKDRRAVLRAKVKEQNIASQVIFEFLGYEHQRNIDGYYYYAKKALSLYDNIGQIPPPGSTALNE